jgi:hypothetical protein
MIVRTLRKIEVWNRSGEYADNIRSYAEDGVAERVFT